ncbi:hypothetical protein V8C37DRAFT_221029 [Trichoderma ceciliae]
MRLAERVTQQRHALAGEKSQCLRYPGRYLAALPFGSSSVFFFFFFFSPFPFCFTGLRTMFQISGTHGAMRLNDAELTCGVVILLHIPLLCSASAAFCLLCSSNKMSRWLTRNRTVGGQYLNGGGFQEKLLTGFGAPPLVSRASMARRLAAVGKQDEGWIGRG